MTKAIINEIEREFQKNDRFENKARVSYYLTKETRRRLNDLYIDRLRKDLKPKKSTIVDQAIYALYLLELGEK